MFVSIENTLSDITEDGWSSNISLYALAQLEDQSNCNCRLYSYLLL